MKSRVSAPCLLASLLLLGASATSSSPLPALPETTLAHFFAQIDTLLIELPSQSAPFVEVETTLLPINGDTTVWTDRGWLKSQDAEGMVLLNPYGRQESLKWKDTSYDDSTRTRMTELTFEDAAAKIMHVEFPTATSDTALYRVSVADWLFHQGHTDLAAGLISPLLIDHREQKLIQHIRAISGLLAGYRMLVAFVGDRDYETALIYARAIRDRYHNVAFKEEAAYLLKELPLRRDDFSSFRLPTPDEWQKLQSQLSRDEQIKYVCKRLRLLNCWQISQPGGLSCSSTQHLEPEGISWNAAWREGRGKTVVINPWVELMSGEGRHKPGGEPLQLTISDIPTLVPFLFDDWYLPGIEFHRDFLWHRKLYRTPSILGEIINRLAGEKLFNATQWESLNASARHQEAERITKWARAHKGFTQEELLRQRFAAATQWRQVDLLTDDLIAYKQADAVPKLLSFLDHPEVHDWQRAVILNVSEQLDGPATAVAAQPYLDYHKEIGLQLTAGVIVARWGNSAAGMKALADVLTSTPKFSAGGAARCVEVLLTSNNPQDREVARNVFSKNYLRPRGDGRDTATLLRHFIEHGYPDPYDWLFQELQDTTAAGGAGGPPQVELQERDRIAQLVVDFIAPKNSGLEYSYFDPGSEKAEDRTKIEAWLKLQLRNARR